MNGKAPLGLKIAVENPTNDPRIDQKITESIVFDKDLFEHRMAIQTDVRKALITVTTLVELPEGVLTQIADKITAALNRKGLAVKELTYTVRIDPSTGLAPGPDEVQ